MLSATVQIKSKKNRVGDKEDDSDNDDLTASFNEQEAFSSIFDALRWSQIRKRVPVCIKKTLHNRYMYANMIYLVYTIGLLVVNNHSTFTTMTAAVQTVADIDLENSTVSADNFGSEEPTLSSPVYMNKYANRFYIALAAMNILIASMYVWAWRGRSWFDVVLLPEYLNHVQAALYLWSAILYPKQDTLGGHYTMSIHRIELAASCTEMVAAVGWVITWYLAYTRTLGRGFSFDDPDTMGYLTLLTNTIMYFVYNITINIHPEQYATNTIYKYADIVGFIGSCFYLFGTLRDDNWFWFLPLAGQYGIAAGKIKIDTIKKLPQFGVPPILITDLCFKRKKNQSKIKRRRRILNQNDIIKTIYL